MDAAAKHENRYRAVIEYANGAMFKWQLRWQVASHKKGANQVSAS
jgi:hypothetical protein